jgi:4-diphosphocytidyl-2C-methyl-D-erythritol kinase
MLCPAVAEWAERLARFGPAGQRMSGSGSSLFALCRDRNEALAIARGLSEGPDDLVRPPVFLVRSCF